MSQHSNSGGNVLMAFVIGAVAGAAVALLYAPATGEETRRRLKEKAQESREKAGDYARDGREFLKRQRESVETAVEKGREAFQQARKETL